jgi:AcrR family transcriptional regulator
MDAEKKLIESFKQLTKEEMVDKITIKEITDGAGVIRSTFYYHFQDKYELIERIFQTEILQPLFPLLDNNMISEMTLLIFKNLEKEKSFYRKLSYMEGQNSFKEIVQRSIRNTLLTYMENHIVEQTRKVLKKHFGWLSLEQIADYYASSMTFVVISWIKAEIDVTPEQVTEVTDMMFTLSLKDVIDIIRTGNLDV